MEAAIIAGAVRMGKRRAVDVVSRALERAAAVSDLGIFTKLQAETALEAAARVDALIAEGKDPGRLAGVPIAVKDNIAEAHQPLTAGSKLLEGYIAPKTATALARLQSEGAIVIAP